MSQFNSSAKQYPDGTGLPGFGSIDVSVTTTGTTLDQTAPPSLLGPGDQPLSFLFWDTGRRLTTKRRVRWTFSHPDRWSDWRAVAWYGTGGPGPGVPEVHAAAYWVGTSMMDPTPIDGTLSTWVNGPGGAPLAYPWNGNDHVLRTEWGNAGVHAKSQMQRSSHDPNLVFSSWIQLVPGGDGSGYFSENDEDIDSTSGGSGVSGIAGDGSIVFSATAGVGYSVLAGYVTPQAPDISWVGKLRDVVAAGLLGKYIDKGDPSPEDIVRLKLISESIDLVRGERPTSTDAFEALVAAGRNMSAQELKRAIVSTQTTLRRGQAAVKSLESLAAKAQALAVKQQALAAKAKSAKKTTRKAGK